LDDHLPRRHQTDLVADREGGAVILDANPPPFGGNAVAGTLDLPQPLPAFGLSTGLPFPSPISLSLSNEMTVCEAS
jgi:hypothetical protein